MKTPRELLFQRHRSAKIKLDAIREKTLSEMSCAKTQSREANNLSHLMFFSAWRDLFSSLRWHFAGMSAVWFFIFLLNTEPSSSTKVMANQPSPTPKQLVLSLRENRRQIAEMIESPFAISPAISSPRNSIPPRRSESQTLIEMA